MMFYGEGLPAFLRNFAPLKHIGYLADCARLDLAQREAYHAADSAPFDPAPLMSEAAEDAVNKLAPSVRILRSDWSLYDLWRFNTVENAPKPQPVAQDVLVTRPEFDPQVHLLPKGAADWFDALSTGQKFGDALTNTLANHPDFDLTASLGLAISSSAFTEGKTKDTA